MSEYKLVVIQTDGKKDVQSEYDGLEFSDITGVQQAVAEAKAKDTNLYTSIQQEEDESSLPTT